MEVIRGHQKKQALRQLQNLLAATVSEEVIPFDRPAAELAGLIAGELERNGQFIGLADPMIAAIALHHGLELVTGNTAHFQRVQRLGYPLTLANWRIGPRRQKAEPASLSGCRFHRHDPFGHRSRRGGARRNSTLIRLSQKVPHAFTASPIAQASLIGTKPTMPHNVCLPNYV
jgi:hypothetical protein